MTERLLPISFRVTRELNDELEEAARLNGRTVDQEMAARLWTSIQQSNKRRMEANG